MEPHMIAQGIFEHYKSTPENRMLYQVLFLSRNESDLSILVTYAPLYHKENDTITHDGVALWTRTLEYFTAEVKYNGKTVHRFKKISTETNL